MKWKPHQFSDAIKGGATFNVLISFSISQVFIILRPMLDAAVKTKTIVNNDQLSSIVLEGIRTFFLSRYFTQK